MLGSVAWACGALLCAATPTFFSTRFSRLSGPYSRDSEGGGIVIFPLRTEAEKSQVFQGFFNL